MSIESKRVILIELSGNGKTSTFEELKTIEKFKKIDFIDNFPRLTRNISEESEYDVCSDNVFIEMEFIEKFLDERINLEKKLPINGFILVINSREKEFSEFIAKQFVKLFGTQTIKSLLILAIKDNSNDHEDDFEAQITQAPGYKYLKKLIHNEDIQFCLWNKSNRNEDQVEAFLKKIKYT
jgi:hypothetical protein